MRPRPIVAAALLAAVVGLGPGSPPVAAQTADQLPPEAPGQVTLAILQRHHGGCATPNGAARSAGAHAH